MKPRQLGILGGVLAALVAAFAAVRVASTRASGDDSLWTGKPADVSRLSIAAEAGKVSFARKDGKWLMTEPASFPADGVALDDVVGRLADVKLSPYLSRNPSKRGLFEVDSSSGIRLSVYTSGEKPSLDLYVGKAGSRFDSFFVRLEGSDEVREAAGLARYLIDKRPKQWLDKTVAAVTSDSIFQIKLKSSSGTITAENDGGGWRIVEPKLDASTEAVKAALEPVFVTLVRLEADEVLLPEEFPTGKKAGFDKPYVRVTVKQKSGAELAFSAGAVAEPGKRWVRKEGDDRVTYVLSNFRIQPFIKSPADFKRKSS